MIFDLTVINSTDNTQDTVRYKPRNKAMCRGVLLYHEEEIASLKTLVVCSTQPEALVGGRFELEWYRKDHELEFLTDNLSIYAEYGEGRPPELIAGWTIPGIAILEDGVPMAVGSIKDLMAGENIFFARRLQVRNYDEEAALEEQDIKDTFGTSELSALSTL